jgi:DNA-binding MarR family transcriptional regulator
LDKEHPRTNLSYQAFVALLKTSSLLLKTGDRFLHRYGITQCQFNILMVLKHEVPEGCSQAELCDHLLVKAANMTGMIRRLRRSGLVDRFDHPSDERARIVRLSKAGDAMLKRIEPEYYDIINKVMGVNTQRESKKFMTLLERTRLAIQQHAPD